MANKLQDESEKWFKDLIKSTAGKRAGENYSKGSRKAMSRGNMLFFKYPNPKTPLAQLKAFDMYPLIFLMEKRPGRFLGLNLHWIPRVFRETVIKMVVKINKQRIKKDKRIEISYKELKEFLTRTGIINVAVKQYLTNRLTGLKYIPYSDWKYQVNLPTEKFITAQGVSASDVEAMIRRAISQNKKSKNTRVGRPVNTGRYKRK